MCICGYRYVSRVCVCGCVGINMSFLSLLVRSSKVYFSDGAEGAITNHLSISDMAKTVLGSSLLCVCVAIFLAQWVSLVVSTAIFSYHPSIHPSSCIHPCVRACAYIRTYMYTCMHAHTYTYRCTCMHTYLRIYIRTCFPGRGAQRASVPLEYGPHSIRYGIHMLVV